MTLKTIKALFLICTIILVYSCGDNINDSSKRNDEWCWWVDEKTHKGEWIPVSAAGNVENGTYTLFFSNGLNSEIGKLKSGKNHDTTFTFNIQGQLIKYETFRNDSGIIYYINDGIYKDYYSDCKVRVIGQIKNHDRTNKWTWYFKNGNIDFYEIYRDSLNYHYNTKVSYYETGQIKDTFNFLNNKQYGMAKGWYQNGQVKAVSFWKDDIIDSLAIRYYENGKMQSKSFYIHGEKKEYTKWDESGKIKE